MVVYVAWRQRQEAKRLLQDVKGGEGDVEAPRSFGRRVLKRWRGGRKRPVKCEQGEESIPSSPSGPLSRFQMSTSNWTLTHGFYAVMGGFAFDSSNASEPFLPHARTRAALTAEGIRFLFEHEPDLLPPISTEEIEDKSKADGLKKFLVCVQAGWFCASCISRLASALPISLLELNAMGHAACALLIYVMWWRKPLDVSEPTLIGGDKAMPLLAFMWMCSRVSAEGMKSQDVHGRLRDEFDALWIFGQPRFEDLIFEDDPVAVKDSGGKHGDGNTTTPSTAASRKERSEDYSRSFRHYSSAAPMGLRYQLVNWLHSKRPFGCFGIRFPAGLGVRRTAIDHVSLLDITRWRLCHEAIQKYQLEADVRSRHTKRSRTYDQDSRVDARIGNLLSLRSSKPYEVWFGFAVAGLLYGGLHLLAWNAPFSSRLEQILWRVAASSVSATPLVLVPLALVFGNGGLRQGSEDLTSMIRHRKVELTERWVKYWARVAAIILFFPFFCISPFLWFAYVLGRVYLVVECFKNITHLPEEAFQDASWSAYFPHIN